MANHLLVSEATERRDFQSTLRASSVIPLASRQVAHGQKLLRQLGELKVKEGQLRVARAEAGLEPGAGMAVTLQVANGWSIDFQKQLEWRRAGIEVLSAKEAGNSEIVTLHIPEGKFSEFEKRITAYLNPDLDTTDKKGVTKPKNVKLVNAVSDFRKAVFEELWTELSPPPAPETLTWFQVWLRPTKPTAHQTRNHFVEVGKRFGIEVDQGYLSFPDRVVVAAWTTRSNLERALELLDLVAEVRGVMPPSDFFLATLKPYEQVPWVQNLAARTTVPPVGQGPHITLLDTGVNWPHPLLAPLLAPADCHAVQNQWLSNDHDGHGTEMAGIAAYGDLAGPLTSAQEVRIPHRLESVKILPPVGENPPRLYGWIMSKATSIAETAFPQRSRTFVTMTTAAGQAGMPTEYSGTIDRLAFGYSLTPQNASANPDARGEPRLFIMSVGNVPWQQWNDYPTVNALSHAQDPAQSWNALVVGACTDLVTYDTTKWPSYTPLAPKGGLSPSSTTSLGWALNWPNRPDVVAEGGNGSKDSRMAVPSVGPESLRVLTTHHEFTRSTLGETGDTSAAAAEVARVAALVQAQYPQYWPETRRGLIAHTAELTPAMLADWPTGTARTEHKRGVLRRYGHGKVDLHAALTSTRDRATLLVQETIQPYTCKEDGTLKLGQLCLHALPWPVEELQRLQETPVEMRVTLSYFIAPNPSRRGWRSKYRYQSHGLRFAVKGATETPERFNNRINKIDRDASDDVESDVGSDPDKDNWFWGAQMRTSGSLHSDTWKGTAAQLALKSHVAVFPVGGWWRDSDAGEATQTVRYSLLVTLKVHATVDVDIYNPIAVKIGLPVEVF